MFDILLEKQHVEFGYGEQSDVISLIADHWSRDFLFLYLFFLNEK